MKIEINAKIRELKGTGASRRLRHSGKVPGVLYGGKNESTSIELDSKELFMQFKHEAFHASILTLNLDGKKEPVLLRDFQMHPVRNNIQHIDLQRIDENKKLSYIITNSLGQTILTNRFYGLNSDMKTIDITKLSVGVYNLILRGNNFSKAFLICSL